MNIIFRRNIWLIITFVFVIAVCFVIGSTRIIAYNIGEGKEIEIEGRNYDNDVYLFDDSVVHEIEIGLSQADYDAMVKIYQDTGNKDFFRAYVTIDGVTIPDAGIRLKGNLTLRQTVGGSGDMGGRPGGVPNNNNEDRQAFIQPGNFELPEGLLADLQAAGLEAPTEEEVQNMFRSQRDVNGREMPMPPDMELPENWEEMTDEERRAYMEENGMGRMPDGLMGGEGNGGNPPFLIKFDEFVTGQTYQQYAEIAVRIGSDKALLAEPVSFYIHEESGQIVPEISYAVVETADNEPSLYVICEHIDEKYVEKHFPDSDGILYKAGNFVGFEYKGDDPTLYTDLFEQKTSINDDDLAPIIRFMKFVSESSDEEFETKLPSWLDMDSFIRMMALDNLLDNNDSFVGMGSNYYLYYDKNLSKFTILSWDMNLAMGSMGGGMRSRGTEGAPQFGFESVDDVQTESIQKRRAIFEEWLQEGGFGQKEGDDQAEDRQGGGSGGRNSVNVLKNRFFANETFSAMYDAEYAKLKDFIFTQNSAAEKIEELAEIFIAYNEEHNIMEQSEYDAGLEKIKSYITQKQQQLETAEE